LPFLSYGGTALIVNCIQIGLLQNVALRRREY
jgi:cell division protein FtsW (lipid II flippase)